MLRSSIFFILVALISIPQACVLREAKEPQFQKDEGSVISELKGLRNFENARVMWSPRSFEKKTIDVLVVELRNGERMIDDEAELGELGREALLLTISGIENVTEYERFEVIFIKETRKGVLTNTYTRTVQYSPEELQ